VALADLTEISVRRALAKFRELGRDAFLERFRDVEDLLAERGIVVSYAVGEPFWADGRGRA
jgi:hypothetical protein